MKRFGTIILYDRINHPVRVLTYESVKRRREIIESWQKQYGKMFGQMSYGIQPTVPED